MGRTAGAVLMGLALAGCPADDEEENATIESSAAYGVVETESFTGTSGEGDSSGSSSSSGGGSTTGGETGSSGSSSGGDTDTDTDGTSTGAGSTSISPDYGVPPTTGE